jgi:hypothetical protein
MTICGSYCADAAGASVMMAKESNEIVASRGIFPFILPALRKPKQFPMQRASHSMFGNSRVMKRYGI